MSDRRTQQRAISALIGSDAQKRAYTQLGLSKDWIDPIFGLTDFERLAIWIYTTPNNWHRIVNEALWRESAPRDVKVFASILNSAIRKLPRVRGIVFRGFTFKVDVAEFLETHGTGQVLVWPGFTSATRSRTRALIGNALFQIESKTGHSLQGYGADEAEEEVLFETATKFRVYDIKRGRDGIVVADLTEET